MATLSVTYYVLNRNVGTHEDKLLSIKNKHIYVSIIHNGPEVENAFRVVNILRIKILHAGLTRGVTTPATQINLT